MASYLVDHGVRAVVRQSRVRELRLPRMATQRVTCDHLVLCHLDVSMIRFLLAKFSVLLCQEQSYSEGK